jgi:hypothetical protein
MYTNRILNFCLVALTCSTILALGSSRHHRGRSMGVDHDGPVASCGELDWTFDDLEVARAEQQVVLRRAEVRQLKISPPMNDGLQVEGWDRDAYSITACKVAGAPASEEARNRVEQISISVANGHVQFRGPSDSSQWSVFLLVKAPRNADLDLKTENGPIALYEVQGHVKASATNGPISTDRCSGEYRLETENDPISVKGGGGDVHVRTENGPISLALEGERWEGAGLEASDQNGPLGIDVPAEFVTGVRIESSGNSPWQCGGPCLKGRKDWTDGGKSVEFGNGPTVVRLSTVNGPVSIGSARGRI